MLIISLVAHIQSRTETICVFMKYIQCYINRIKESDKPPSIWQVEIDKVAPCKTVRTAHADLELHRPQSGSMSVSKMTCRVSYWSQMKESQNIFEQRISKSTYAYVQSDLRATRSTDGRIKQTVDSVAPRSNCANAQADLELHYPHTAQVSFCRDESPI